MVKLADAVALALLKAMAGGQTFVFGLENRERDRLRRQFQGAAQDVIGAAFGTAAAFAIDDVDGGGGLLDADVLTAPAAVIEEHRVDELEARLLFVAWHVAAGRSHVYCDDTPKPERGQDG